MKSPAAPVVRWFGVVALAVSGAACASSADASDNSADAINANQAASEFTGAVRKFVGSAVDADVRALGVVSWSAYAVKQGSFTGVAMFGLDAANDVKYGVLMGQEPGAKHGEYHLSLVNYNTAGKAGTKPDPRTLKTLSNDMKMILAGIEAADAADEVKKCATGVATVALGAILLVVGGWAVEGSLGAAAGVVWLATSTVVGAEVLAGTGLVVALGGMTTAIVATVNVVSEVAVVAKKSCGALL